MRLAAGGAALDQEFALFGGFPERRGLGIALRRRIFFCFSHHARSRMQVEAAWRTPSRPPVPWAMREIAVRHLHLRMRLAAQLPHRLDDLGHAAAVDGVIAAEPAAVGVERQFSDAGNQIAVGDELAALALLAEAEVLQLHQHRDGKTVVDRGVFDVLRRDAGLLEGARAGPDAGGVSEIEILAAARALHRLAMADQAHQRLLQALGNLRRGDDQRAAAVGDDAAIHPVQRIGDHRRVQHVLDGDDVLQHRVRIVLRVMGGRDLDPGQLLAGGAVVVHVAHGTHAVGVVGGGAIGGLEIGLGAGGPRRHRAGARLARQGDQRDRAFAGGDGFGGVAEMDQIGTAAGLGGVHVADLQAEVIDHRPQPARARRRRRNSRRYRPLSARRPRSRPWRPRHAAVRWIYPVRAGSDARRSRQCRPCP